MSSKVQRGSLAGSVLTAFMASACCLGPILFSLLGISSVGFLMKFEEYRTEFTAIALILLGIAGYFTYRKKPVEACDTGSHCANPRSDRINKVVFWIAAALVAVMILYPTILARFTD